MYRISGAPTPIAGRRAAVLAFMTALMAPLVAAIPAAAADPAPVRDGASQTTAAASCWEIKQNKPAATDGTYWLQTPQLIDPRKFHCDMTTDGGGWVLIGRGRENWSYDYNGAGTSDAVAEVTTGKDAFPVKQLDGKVINALMGGRRIDSMSDGVRLRRARNAAGTQFQETSFTFKSRDRWSWAFSAGFPMASAKIDGASTSGTTRDFGTDNGWRRLWTYETSANNYVRGFQYGYDATGSTDPNSYLYSSASGGRYPSPFTQMYLRPKLLTSDLTYDAIPAAGLPKSEQAPIPNSGSIPNEWGVTGLGNGGTSENANEVQAFAQIGNVMYVGGNFTTVLKGQNATGSDRISQRYLAAFDATTGNVPVPLPAARPEQPGQGVDCPARWQAGGRRRVHHRQRQLRGLVSWS